MSVESVTLTRHGWIKHLATVQGMLKLVATINENVEPSFGQAQCEIERKDKISKAITKLQELIWETGAVSERIHRERGDRDPDFDALDRDMCDERSEAALARLWDAAKELERCARSMWDPAAPETVEPEVVYPGPVEQPSEGGDPNQPLLGLTPGAPREPPAVAPSRLVDYKMQQANDDTTTPEGDGE